MKSQYPTKGEPELYSVDIDSLLIKQILSIPAIAAKYNSSGNKIIFHNKKGRENIFRKHRRSSSTSEIFSYDLNSLKFKQITDNKGSVKNKLDFKYIILPR